jgi:hypothetical protein
MPASSPTGTNLGDPTSATALSYPGQGVARLLAQPLQVIHSRPDPSRAIPSLAAAAEYGHQRDPEHPASPRHPRSPPYASTHDGPEGFAKDALRR